MLDGLVLDIHRRHVDLQEYPSIASFARLGHMHTFVMQTTTGTFNANEIAKCSFYMPIRPAFAPTMRITHDGAPDVRPYSVVFKYRS